jgi:SpoVK/Ycf46/Vps4 family AAA+-type ATPase
MNIKVEKPNRETILYFQNFENKYADFIKKTYNDIPSPQFIVKSSLSLENDDKKRDASFYITSDASFSLGLSNDFSSKTQFYLTTYQKEFDAMVPSGQILHVDLNFSKRENTEDVSKDVITYIPIEGRYDFDQIILPDNLRKEIFEALDLIKYQDLIYNQWGFKSVDPVAKSVLNFYGPPGTGKTMCAHAIAKKCGRKLLALNYAEIESKYVGDAAKNLTNAFDVARKQNCILFFDEADSFLGKRIQNVSQGADQALNSLRSQMLILLEEFPGIVIFATNLVTNFDPAFDSRILKHLKFELPNVDARIAIIKKMLPEKLPMLQKFTDDDFKSLSLILEGLSGREIKNAVLETLLSKASIDGEKSLFSFDDFKNGFVHKKDQLEKLKEEKNKEIASKILAKLGGSKVEKEESQPTEAKESEAS